MITRNITILFLSFIFICCKSPLEINPINFDIEMEKMEVGVGEALNFRFNGEANYVSFFSGEEGHKYEHRKRLYIEDGVGKFSFASITAPKSPQNITMKVYISNDFTGDYSLEAVEKATWNELTDLITWPVNVITEVLSGEIDITQYAGGRPLFVAFKYVGKSGAIQPAWILRKIKIDYKTESKVYPIISSMVESDFKFAYSEENANRKWPYNSVQIRMAGAPIDAPDYTAWAITKGFYLNKVKSDVGLGVIDMINKPKEFEYVYNSPGEYNLVFVCRNATVRGEIVEIKEFKIKVTE